MQLFYSDISYNSLEQSPAYDAETLLSMSCCRLCGYYYFSCF